MTMTATYSPDDNKLRLYADGRLSPADFATVKAAGFRWAPKQGLFVAPMWTPAREDLLLSLAGEIGDEDKSLVERQAERAERFDGYSANRTADAEAAHARVSAICENIPLGQPILVGHHSERHARADQKRIETGMRKALKMWDTASYWEQRATGALAHAKYKELPRVRANRIKKIEADKRAVERSIKQTLAKRALWEACDSEAMAQRIAADGWFTVVKNGVDSWSAYDLLRDREYDALPGTPLMTWQQVREVLRVGDASTIPHFERWIAHYNHRLTYERAMLEEQGASALLDKKPKSAKAQSPLLNYRAPGGSITTANPWSRGNSITYRQIDMTKAQYSALHSDYKATRWSADKSHRFRTAMVQRESVCVFLTDSKVHSIPAPTPPTDTPPPAPPAPRAPKAAKPAPDSRIAATREALKNGVHVVAVNQLFPTPPEIAARVVELAEIEPGHRVLEPSAGTGNLIGAMGGRMFGHNPERGALVAMEINKGLCDQLAQSFPLTQVICCDFLDCVGAEQKFDRVIMNPPFENGADIKHIKHARELLKPGGRLVAICANGPRQAAALGGLVDRWIDLPPGSFKDAGTNVNTAIVVINAA